MPRREVRVTKAVKHPVVAIILAAGEGKRIGLPKWQLPFEEKTFLERICLRLEDVPVAGWRCVVSGQSIPPFLERSQRVINPHPEEGMLSSIFWGIKAHAKKTAGYLIIPVDHPFVMKHTYEKLLDVFQSFPDQVIRPRYQGRLGHPIILPKLSLTLLSSEHFNKGLKKYLIDNKADFVDIDIDDPGVLKNINTWDDLT